jgi:hypothetical protein
MIYSSILLFAAVCAQSQAFNNPSQKFATSTSSSASLAGKNSQSSEPSGNIANSTLAIADAGQSNNPVGVLSDTALPPTGFCSTVVGQNGVLASDGTQQKGNVVCSSTPLGVMPDVNKMVSTLITSPANLGVVDASKDTTVTLATRNLVTGFFSNATTFYYTTSQSLNNGNSQGHAHITMQLLDGTNVLDGTVFAFFKGINDAAVDQAAVAGNNRDTLQATIPAGAIKVDGNYRICSMSGFFTHQPQLSPVIARGPTEDCIRVTVINSALFTASAVVAGSTTVALPSLTTDAVALEITASESAVTATSDLGSVTTSDTTVFITTLASETSTTLLEIATNTIGSVEGTSTESFGNQPSAGASKFRFGAIRAGKRSSARARSTGV